MINENRRTRALLWFGILALALFAVLPYYWVLRTSLIPDLASMQLGTSYLPLDRLTIEPYLKVWNQYNFVRYFRNSAVVAIASTILALILAIPGAYAFARLDFPGRSVLFYTAVFTLMFPAIVLTIPVYEIFYRLKLLDSIVGIVIALTIFVMPLALWLLQGFFRQGIPENIEEAALIDGTTNLGAFVRVVLPLSAPAIGATALFAFLNAWNNFIWVFLLTTSEDVRTATVAIHFVMGSDVLREWSILMAGTVMLVLPPIVFYGISQNYVGQSLGGR